MVVGEDITVTRDDETGTGRLVGVTITIPTCRLATDGNTDSGIDILLINICRAELFSGFSLSRLADAGKSKPTDKAAEKDKCNHLSEKACGTNGIFHTKWTSFVFTAKR